MNKEKELLPGAQGDSTAEGDEPGGSGRDRLKFRPLRIWPALVLVALVFVTRYLPHFLDGGMSRFFMIAVMGR